MPGALAATWLVDLVASADREGGAIRRCDLSTWLLASELRLGLQQRMARPSTRDVSEWCILVGSLSSLSRVADGLADGGRTVRVRAVAIAETCGPRCRSELQGLCSVSAPVAGDSRPPIAWCLGITRLVYPMSSLVTTLAGAERPRHCPG